MVQRQTREATTQLEVVEKVTRDAPSTNVFSDMICLILYYTVIVFKLVEDDSEERRKSSGGELFRNNELSGGVFLSD